MGILKSLDTMCNSTKLSFIFGIMILILPGLVRPEIPTIGVIGGGIGGTASAYFLRQLFGAGKVKIHLYERGRIGGRLATVPVNGHFYETGGSIIHPRNKYMQSFVKTFGLKPRTGVDRRMGLYSGKEFVYEDSDWSLISYFRLVRRYGFGIFKIKGYIEEMLNDFDGIYTLQNSGEAFNTVMELLGAMSSDFPRFLKTTASKGFNEAGFSERVIHELIAATTQVNYGQSPTDIHKFVGMVSTAGATGNLWAVEGGNFKVPLSLLEHSGAQLFSKNVLKVGLEPSGKLRLTVDEDGTPQEVPQAYDMVIICAPQANNTKLNIDLSDFGKDGWNGNYQRIISTILSGRLNNSYFGVNQTEDMPEEILLTSGGQLINSVGRLSPVEGKSNSTEVWKVFSAKPLSESDLDLLFLEHDEESIQINDWLAYPHYKNPSSHDSFLIHDNVFYLNVIEWAASAMEMSAIGAKNVALLAYKFYTKAAESRKNRQNQSVVSGTPNYEL